MNVAQETLGLRRGSFSLPLSLLMSAFALFLPPDKLTILLRRPTERSPTAHTIPEAHSPKVVAFANPFGIATNLQTERERHHLLVYRDEPVRLDFDGRFVGVSPTSE